MNTAEQGNKVERLFTVALCWFKQNTDNSVNIGMSARTLLAKSEGDAFIDVYDRAKAGDFKDHSLHAKIVYEIPMEQIEQYYNQNKK